MSMVPRSVALSRLTHHQFVAGMGYVAHGMAPELPPDANGSKNCAPPAGTADGSVHLMRPPTGADPVRMIWTPTEGAWAAEIPQKGNRMAWSTEHLMRAGWEYGGPA